MDIKRNYKETVNIINKFADKVIKLRIASELDLNKLPRNIKVEQDCDDIMTEIEAYKEKEELKMAYKRSVQLVKVLSRKFFVLIRDYPDYKLILLREEQAYIRELFRKDAYRLGAVYFKRSNERYYFDQAQNVFRDIENRYINVCTYYINEEEKRNFKQLARVMKYLINNIQELKMEINFLEYKRDLKNTKILLKAFNENSKEVRELNKGVDAKKYLITLTPDDMCYLGANDYTVQVNSSEELVEGMRFAIKNSVKFYDI